jgi:hypothetical protein
MMRRSLLRTVVAAVAFGIVLGAAAPSEAQGAKRGQVTDEWDNPLEGVTVLADPAGADGTQQTTTTDDGGNFSFIGLGSGDWAFTVLLDGYQGLQQVANVRRTGQTRPLSFEMPVLASGGRFRERTEFRAEGGTPRFRFEEDGMFEFEDEQGEGEGTYGIVDLSAVLVVREYGGPDDKFNLQTPVVVEFPSNQFNSMTYNGVQLAKR